MPKWPVTRTISTRPAPPPTYAPGLSVVDASYAPNPSSPQPTSRGPTRSITSGDQIGSGNPEPELGTTPSAPTRNSTSEKLYPAPNLKPVLDPSIKGPGVSAGEPADRS